MSATETDRGRIAADDGLTVVLADLGDAVGQVAARAEVVGRGATSTAATVDAQLVRLTAVARLSHGAAAAAGHNQGLADATAAGVDRAVEACGTVREAATAAAECLRQVATIATRPGGLLAEVLAAVSELNRAAATVAAWSALVRDDAPGDAAGGDVAPPLADQARDIADRVATLARVVDARTRSAVDAVGRTAAGIGASLAHVGAAERGLAGLTAHLRDTAGQSRQAAVATAEQIEALSDIARHGSDVQAACRETAATADGTAETIAAVAAAAARLRDLSAVAASRRLGPVAAGPAVDVNGAAATDLTFGGQAQANETALVDALQASRGCSATLFGRVGTPGRSDDGFVRLATSVRRADGTRAVGTRLNPRGAAAPHLLRGTAYVGPVFILGRPFIAAYDPIHDAAGTVIGAWYVGHALPPA